MLKKLLLNLRAYFVAYIVVFLALGGTSYAASGKHGPFLQGSGNATFGRLALEGGPPAGADTLMTPILSINGLGDVLMYCVTDTTHTGGGFAFRNTTSEPVIVSGFGTLQPGQRTFGGEGHMSGPTVTFQVTSEFNHPDRIATVITSGYVEGNVCKGHAQAIAQP